MSLDSIYRSFSPLLFSEIRVSKKSINSLKSAIESIRGSDVVLQFVQEGLFIEPEHTPLWPAKPGDPNFEEVQQHIRENSLTSTSHNEDQPTPYREAMRNTLDGLLLSAISCNNLSLAEKTLRLGANPAVSNELGKNTLIIAIEQKNKALFNLIMGFHGENKSLFNLQDRNGNHSLIYAVLQQTCYYVRPLLLAGADPNLKNVKNYFARMYAENNSVEELLYHFEQPDPQKLQTLADSFIKQLLSGLKQNQNPELIINVCLDLCVKALESLLDNYESLSLSNKLGQTNKLLYLGDLFFAYANFISVTGDLDELAIDARDIAAVLGNSNAQDIAHHFPLSSHLPQSEIILTDDESGYTDDEKSLPPRSKSSARFFNQLTAAKVRSLEKKLADLRKKMKKDEEQDIESTLSNLTINTTPR